MGEFIKVLFVGDIVGQPGLQAFSRLVPKIKQKYNVDAVVVNGENAAKDGRGISLRHIEFLRNHGADLITTGNHIWDNKEVYAALDERSDIIRPANYPSGCPGKGYATFLVKNHTVAVLNLYGRVSIRDSLDCPFRAADSLVLMLKQKTNIIFLDFHGEATSEKCAMGLYLDGRVSGVYGTHTHIQTADERVLPKGTSYQTDLGSCGALNSVIGFEADGAIKRFLLHPRASRLKVEERGALVLCGVVVTVDTQTGKSTHIERVREFDEAGL